MAARPESTKSVPSQSARAEPLAPESADREGRVDARSESISPAQAALPAGRVQPGLTGAERAIRANSTPPGADAGAARAQMRKREDEEDVVQRAAEEGESAQQAETPAEPVLLAQAGAPPAESNGDDRAAGAVKGGGGAAGEGGDSGLGGLGLGLLGLAGVALAAGGGGGASPAPAPAPPPAPSFQATESADGTVSFGGTASGPIVITVDEGDRATFSREDVSASVTVENISAKVFDVPPGSELVINITGSSGDNTYAINSPNAGTIRFAGNAGTGSDSISLIVESATDNPDLRTLTLDTSALTGV